MNHQKMLQVYHNRTAYIRCGFSETVASAIVSHMTKLDTFESIFNEPRRDMGGYLDMDGTADDVTDDVMERLQIIVPYPSKDLMIKAAVMGVDHRIIDMKDLMSLYMRHVMFPNNDAVVLYQRGYYHDINYIGPKFIECMIYSVPQVLSYIIGDICGHKRDMYYGSSNVIDILTALINIDLVPADILYSQNFLRRISRDIFPYIGWKDFVATVKMFVKMPIHLEDIPIISRDAYVDITIF